MGRGTVHPDKPLGIEAISHSGAKIYKGGKTHVTLYGGHVMRNVFGGGRGYDNWGREGWMSEEEKLTMDRSSKGFVFGSTDVNIRGGEIGTGGMIYPSFVFAGPRLAERAPKADESIRLLPGGAIQKVK